MSESVCEYRLYTEHERNEIKKIINVGKTLPRKTNRDGVDMGECQLTRRNGTRYIYKFSNPVCDDPPKLTQAQCYFICANGKLPKLPFCLSHLLENALVVKFPPKFPEEFSGMP